MFEPETLTLAELAERWQRTPRQVLEYAQQLGIPLYFNFAGLAFDLEDKWRRFSGDQWRQEELGHLKKSITAKEELIARARDKQLSQWEHLPAGGAPQLRAEINAMWQRQKVIDAQLEQREEERNLCTCAYLRPGPGTLKLIADNGDVDFPRWAFHPGAKITARQVLDERGNPHLEWEGRIMCLEPRSDDDPAWQKRLAAGDLFASMVEVKAVEAALNPGMAPKPEEAEADIRIDEQAKSTVYKAKSRIRLLDAEIERARVTAASDNYHAVWTALKEMALQSTSPFTGEVDGKKGLAYSKEDGIGYLSKDALRKRMAKEGDGG